MKEPLKDTANKIEKLLKSPANNLKQLSQIYLVRGVLIYWLVCHIMS